MKVFTANICGDLQYAARLINSKFNSHGIDAAQDLIQLKHVDSMSGSKSIAIFRILNIHEDIYNEAFKQVSYND